MSLKSGYEFLQKGEYINARVAFEAEHDDPAAKIQIAYMNQFGLGCPPDKRAAEDSYLALRSSTDPYPSYYLGHIEFDRGNIQKAIAYFHEAADLNHPSAAYWTAKLLSQTDDPNQMDRALEMYRKANDLGHFYAARDLIGYELRSTTNPMKKILLYFRKTKIKILGVMLILKDRNDIRIR